MEEENRRWLLGLDDDKLCSEHLEICYDMNKKSWIVTVPLPSGNNTNNNSIDNSMNMKALKCYWTPSSLPNTTELIPPGSSQILWKGCSILCGKHKLKVMEITPTYDLQPGTTTVAAVVPINETAVAYDLQTVDEVEVEVESVDVQTQESSTTATASKENFW